MFEVDTGGLVQTAQHLDDYGASLAQLSSRLRKQAGAKVMSDKSYRSVISLMYSVAQNYDSCATSSRGFASSVRMISTTYASTERDIITYAQTQTKATSKGSTSAKPSGEGSKSAVTGSGKESSDEKSVYKEMANFLKVLKELLPEDESKTAGDAANLFSYLDSLTKFYQKDNWGASGFKGLLDICKDSLGLWKALYDRMVRAYGVKGLQGLGIFTQNGQMAVSALGIMGSVIGLGSTVVDLATSTYSSTFDMVTTYIDKIGNSVASGAKSIYDAKALYDLINGGAQVTSKTAGCALMGLINGGVAIVTSSAKSFDRYVMSDGKCSVDDVCTMGIDISISGLYYGFGGGLVDALFDVKGGEQISESLKDFGKNAGEWLAMKSLEGGWDWVFRIGQS